MAKKYKVLVERDEDGWLVSEVIGMPGCHTQARNMKELRKRTKEAIRAYEDGPLGKVITLNLMIERNRYGDGGI